MNTSRRIGVQGGEKLRRTLRRFPDALTHELKGVIADGADKILTDAQANVAVHTGELKKALTAKVSKDGLGAKVGYSPKRGGFKRAWKKAGWRFHFIEFGTKKQPAKPFLRPAFRKHIAELRLEVNAAVQKTLRLAATWKG